MYDPEEIDTGDGAEFGELDEFGIDEDVIINDYEGQDTELINDGDNEIDNDNDEDEDILDGMIDVDFVSTFTTNFTPKYKRTSGISKLSKYEYSVLYGKLAQYIQQNKISIPNGLLEDNEIKSGDIFRISRRWIQRRNEFPIPISIQRMLFHGSMEKKNPADLKIDEDYDFKDENDDTYRFYYNFRKNPYDTSS